MGGGGAGGGGRCPATMEGGGKGPLGIGWPIMGGPIPGRTTSAGIIPCMGIPMGGIPGLTTGGMGRFCIEVGSGADTTPPEAM